MSNGAVEEQIPGDVRRYLAASVPSVPYLEAALLLRSEPDAYWNADNLSARLYVRQRDAADLLRDLVANGVAVASSEGFVRYTGDPVLRGVLDSVARTYAAHLFEVTKLLHSKGDRRAHVFAEAFRIRKEDGNG